MAFGEECDQLARRRVDEPGAADHDRGNRLVAVRVLSHDRCVVGAVPDVVFDTFDAELVEFALQHRAESATGPPVEIDPADDFRRLLGHARCNDAGADVFPVGLHTCGAHGDVAGRGWQTGTMTTPESDSSVYLARLAKVRAAMAVSDIDTLLLSVGHDLPYLTGYTAMPLERLTMLVVPRDAGATMVIPALEAPRVRQVPGVFDLLPWGETQDPTAIVAGLAAGSGRVAVGDQMWARFLVELLPQLPGAEYTRAVDVVGPLRMSKDQAEIDALAAAGAAVDRIAGELQRGEIPLVGRTEAEVSAHLGRRILEEGHDKVNFAIVAAGENAASPHHHAGSRVIREHEIVLCDFGGTMNGYCSDTTRCVFTGEPIAEVAEAYAVLREAQRVGVEAGTVGTPCEEIDRATRRVIDDAGYGDFFIHRTGHGIGMEEHEDPYIVEGNTLPLEAGHAYSVEPGIYVPGKWGMRLEDIVVATADGPVALNNSDHSLVGVG